MIVSDARHEFIRVERGQRIEHVVLRSSVTIDGEIFTTQMAFPFADSTLIMAQLNACEDQLAQAVGRKIVKGVKK